MKFLIDHTTCLIHRTPYAGDACQLYQTPLEQREGTHDQQYIDELMKSKNYAECGNCSNIDMF
ncbi:hypothetical protein [Salibacterium aidingense]|uniref:hypothetical protein n=1 Tax=Salibacterium aidingense TaxID=384933 RepID=UPI0005526511|nr:hypothetical protein [Salibacterium aidingense]